MDVVWLKRDARLTDHEPLAIAARSGRDFLILYMYEPDQLIHETVHGSHICFINEGLIEMDTNLRRYSGSTQTRITTRYGEATQILSSLHAQQKINQLISHEETGHNASYARDRRVGKWCRQNGVQWTEIPQAAVVRGLSLRDPSWHQVCEENVQAFLAIRPEATPFDCSGKQCKLLAQRLLTLGSEGFLSVSDLGLSPEIACDRTERQQGGESKAKELLESFLDSRGERYAGSGTISSPNSAWMGCSRLSPYLAWGHISTRTVAHAVKVRQASARGRWAKSLEAFLVRMEWRRDRIQAFEMRCWMEFKSVCASWEHLRQGNTFMYGHPSLLGHTSEEQRISAFQQGKTGYPMVDACMRCLLHTGWVNFRMRCMLASFAVFNLWLDWRAIAGHLARTFLDYEPGIHYTQLQLHAGTFGGMLHCYNVTKQAKDHDPEGVFIRRYVPELAQFPDQYIHEPWKMPASARPASRASGRRWGGRYPSPIVDDRKTAEASRKVIEAAHKEMGNRDASDTGVEEFDDQMLQLAMKQSMLGKEMDTKELSGSSLACMLDGEFTWAMQDSQDDSDLQKAIEASLAGG